MRMYLSTASVGQVGVGPASAREALTPDPPALAEPTRRRMRPSVRPDCEPAQSRVASVIPLRIVPCLEPL